MTPDQIAAEALKCECKHWWNEPGHAPSCPVRHRGVVAEVVRKERERCEKVINDKYAEFAKRSYPPPSLLTQLAAAIRGG